VFCTTNARLPATYLPCFHLRRTCLQVLPPAALRLPFFLPGTDAIAMFWMLMLRHRRCCGRRAIVMSYYRVSSAYGNQLSRRTPTNATGMWPTGDDKMKMEGK